MAEGYTLIECSRSKATTASSNSMWTTLVSSSGIQVNPGDQISLEAAALQSRGASGQVMELRGAQTDGPVVDNSVEMELAFYVNDCGRNAVRLPLVNAPTHMGPFYAGDNNSVATLKCRGLGLPGVA